MADKENRQVRILSDEQIKEVRDQNEEWLKSENSDMLHGMPESMPKKTVARNTRDIGSTNHLSRVDFTGSTTRYDALDEEELIKHRIAACREAYENAGIISNAIDLMVDFALEGIVINHENKAIQRFMWQWADRVNLGNISKEILKSYFLDSNTPVLTFRGRITTGEIRKFRSKNNLNKSESQKLFVRQDITRNRIIPYKYAVLDVLKLHIDGGDLFGFPHFDYDLDRDQARVLADPGQTGDEVFESLKDALGDDAFDTLTRTGRLRIDPRRLDMIYYKKDGYRMWANPFIWRTVDNLKFKKLLRDMDISVAESVINTLTIIAIGDTVNGFPPTPAMFVKLGSLLKTKSKSQTLVWNDLIKIIAEYPPVEKILGKEKYEQVDVDIRSSLGIAEVILSGTGKGNFSNSFISVKTLVERLETARQSLLAWLQKQMKIVQKAMDFSKPAVIQFRHMSLQDEEAEKRLLLDLVDRGMISYKNVIERFGENFDIEVQRMKEEDQFRRKNETKFPYVLVKTGKFGPSLANGPVPIMNLLDSETLDDRQTDDASLKREQNKMGLEEQKETIKEKKRAQKLPTQQGSQPRSGGRPAQTKKPQKKKSTPRNKPKGQDNSGKSKANIVVGQKIFDKLYVSLSNAFVKGHGFENARSITPKLRQQIFSSIVNIIGEFDSLADVTKENVEFLLKAIRNQKVNSDTLEDSVPKIDTKVKETVDQLIEKFKSNNGHLPNKSEIRDIVSSTYAFYRN